MTLRARRRRRLRRAAQAQRAAQRPHLLSGPVRQADQPDHARRQAAPPRAQHDLRRRALAAALDRHGRRWRRRCASSWARRRRRSSSTWARSRPATTTPKPTCRSRIRSSSSRWTRRTGMILIEGNAAAAIGCMMAGVTFVGWYPITPSSSLCESLIDYLKKYRKDPETGKATYAVIQAEDELAALGMVHRRRLDGRARDDVDRRPRHLADGRVHRPRLLRRSAGGDLRRAARAGRPPACRRAPAQQDILSTAVLSHGDTKHPLLLPALGAPSATRWRWTRSTSPSGCRRRSS